MTVFLPAPQLLDSPRGRPWPSLPAPGDVPADPPPSETEVAVVGAGPAGLSVVSALWHDGVRDVVVLDRDPAPCARFFARIDRLGQRVLRSPYEHHPGVEGYRDCELLDFARMHWGRLTPVERREIRMAQSGHRSVVPVDVFEAYCEHLSATHGMDRVRRAEVREVREVDDRVRITTDTGVATARFAVLCPGEERREAPTGWWGGGPTPPGVHYWDEPGAAPPPSLRSPAPGADRVVVVGAGLTAAHLVTAALGSGARVDWVVRAEREHYQCADVNASFFRPEGRARFEGRDRTDRRAMLRAHRRASIMFEFRPRLERAESEGSLVVHRARTVLAVAPGAVTLDDGTRVRGDRIALALGTVPNGVAGGASLLAPEIAHGDDGWPDLDPRTLAHARSPRVFAVGATTSMVLGPAARNIDGHRVATARVAAAIAGGLRRGTPRRPEVGVGVDG
ncbi:hypothetical protein [Actinomycetospora atypica]|uniref:Uncharacterized protein n=1 Tax=Actinomycetospora atypica TaxID=1290095 RepID=A0ABV9YS60_9PSEU